MPALTRGPLPPLVYWRRRLILLTVVLVLLWGAAHLVGGGDDSTPAASTAAHLTGTSSSASPKAAASPSSSVDASPSASAPAVTETPTPTPTPTVRPTPTGACPPSDLSVTPTVPSAAAGSDVAIVLNLTTFTTPACTWQVSPQTMQVKVSTAHGTDVWSTIDCPAALPKSDVVVYQDTPTQVTVTWSARRSDSTCSTHTAWARQGTYAVTGVALGGTPDQASFDLGTPVAPTPPAAPAPQPSSTATAAAPNGSAAAQSTPTASASPSPAGTPKKKHRQKKHIVAD